MSEEVIYIVDFKSYLPDSFTFEDYRDANKFCNKLDKAFNMIHDDVKEYRIR